MHELGIAQQIVRIAMDSIPPEHAGTPVEAVHLRVGALTAVVPASLEFCFQVVARDTRLAGARLEMEQVPVVARCRACGAQCALEAPPFVCAECGAGDLDLLSGRELLVRSIELADPEEE